MLLQQLLRNLPEATITLEVRASNHAAIALYRALEFRATARRRAYYRPATPSDSREDAVIMQRAPSRF